MVAYVGVVKDGVPSVCEEKLSEQKEKVGAQRELLSKSIAALDF